jgi:uncharacterized protein
MKREIYPSILKDLSRKMVFLSGPRQTGKTWLAKAIMPRFSHPLYLNWDNEQDRRVILGQGWSAAVDLLVLDEIHKMPQWKNHLKGIWDTRPERMAVLITGSARLETFRRSGDSLAGRYFHHRLFPLTPAELEAVGLAGDLERFLLCGGFPEPWLAEDEAEAGRWRRLYLDGLIREDILNFENITRLKDMNLLLELLRNRVASPISYHGLAEDLEISPNTVKHYIEILEALYIVFRVYPHHRSIARAIKQQPKIYFFDIPLANGEGQRLENLVALSLHRHLCRQEDLDGIIRELRYLRTRDGMEVDFLITKDNHPELMLEVKQTDRALSPGLLYFQEKYQMDGVQLVGDLRLEDHSQPPRVLRLYDYLRNLGT